MEISVKPNQSVIDIAIEHCGSIYSVPEICRLNDISVTDSLTVGTVLTVPEPLSSIVASQVNNLSTQQ